MKMDILNIIYFIGKIKDFLIYVVETENAKEQPDMTLIKMK